VTAELVPPPRGRASSVNSFLGRIEFFTAAGVKQPEAIRRCNQLVTGDVPVFWVYSYELLIPCLIQRTINHMLQGKIVGLGGLLPV